MENLRLRGLGLTKMFKRNFLRLSWKKLGVKLMVIVFWGGQTLSLDLETMGRLKKLLKNGMHGPPKASIHSCFRTRIRNFLFQLKPLISSSSQTLRKSSSCSPSLLSGLLEGICRLRFAEFGSVKHGLCCKLLYQQ